MVKGRQQEQRQRRGLASVFLSCLKRKQRGATRDCPRESTTTTSKSPTIATPTSTSTIATSSPPSLTQQTNSTYFEPNWENLVPSSPVDVDDCSSTDEDNCTSGESSQEENITGTNDDAQLPLSRRILVDLACAVESLPPPVSPGKPRPNGNASLGDAQPRQPSRKRNGHAPSHNDKSFEQDTRDDLSSCSGITMDSILDHSLFPYGERVVSTLLKPPHFSGDDIASFNG